MLQSTPLTRHWCCSLHALIAGGIDVMDFYSTDAEIARYDLLALRDDKAFFPAYHAVILFRRDLEERHPEAVVAIRRLEGRISESEMVALNARAIVDGLSEKDAAREFVVMLSGPGAESEQTPVDRPGRWGRIALRTREHLFLVLTSMIAAVFVSIPLGIW